MNIFNIKSFPSEGGDDAVGGVQSSQPVQSSVGRPQRPVHHEKPFEKYMDEPKKGKEKGETSQESAVMESPLLAKMGKVPAEMKAADVKLPGEMEDLGGRSAAFPSSFPTKEAKKSSIDANTSFPAASPETKKSASSHKMGHHEHGVDASSKAHSSHPHEHVKKSSLGGEEDLNAEGIASDEDIVPIDYKKKSPDEVVWGATSAVSNKPAGDAMGGDVSQQFTPKIEAVGSQPKLRPEVVLKGPTFEDKGGMVVETPKSSKKVEDNSIPVIGGEVKTMNVVLPHTQPNLSVAEVSPLEVKAPTASTSASLKSLVEQIVSSVDTLTKGERMESVITLKPSPTLPPGFENATIRLTSVASARGEVNINFGGLTQSAVQLVQNNQADLLNALSTRGVTVHIFSASTQQDSIAAQASGSGQQQQQQQSFGQPSQQQRRQQNQEEGEYT